MGSIKQGLAAFLRRPSESWRFLRQAVHEIHFVLNGATQLAAELEARLARLEAQATHGSPLVSDAPRRKTRRAAPRSAGKRSAPRT